MAGVVKSSDCAGRVIMESVAGPGPISFVFHRTSNPIVTVYIFVNLDYKFPLSICDKPCHDSNVAFEEGSYPLNPH